MKKNLKWVFLALAVLILISYLAIGLSSLSDLFPIPVPLGNLAFHFPILSGLFFQLFASIAGTRPSRRRLPLVIGLCGVCLGIAAMFAWSFLPLFGFLAVMVSIMHTAGSLLAMLLYRVALHLCPETADP